MLIDLVKDISTERLFHSEIVHGNKKENIKIFLFALRTPGMLLSV